MSESEAELADKMHECPLQKKHGDIICAEGDLWALTHSECAPPDQRQYWGKCDHCHRKYERTAVKDSARSEGGYCEACQNTGSVDCHCGGDLCICENYGEMECPVCHGMPDADDEDDDT